MLVVGSYNIGIHKHPLERFKARSLFLFVKCIEALLPIDSIYVIYIMSCLPNMSLKVQHCI